MKKIPDRIYCSVVAVLQPILVNICDKYISVHVLRTCTSLEAGLDLSLTSHYMDVCYQQPNVAALSTE